MKIVAITGGSGAGKTVLAHALARRIGPKARVIAEDDYYRCASAYPDFDPASHNFDAPEAKEHALLREHLARARDGAPFDKPSYDLVTHRRKSGVERIAGADVLIVEGIHLLCPEDLRPLFDLKVFVDADEALRLGRRMVRDMNARGRSAESVLAQFFTSVRPMHEQHVAPQRELADIVLTSAYGADAESADRDALRLLEALR